MQRTTRRNDSAVDRRRQLYNREFLDGRASAGHRLEVLGRRGDEFVGGPKCPATSARRDGDAHAGRRVRPLLPADRLQFRPRRRLVAIS